MLVEELKEILAHNLPGESAHQKMAPINRPLSSIALARASNYKESAVAIILLATAIPEIVLIQRPFYEGNHSGQVSFPGGKKEASDSDLTETAIRECFEEIGVQLGLEMHLGKLSPVFIPVSNFRIDANLFYLDSKPDFQQDEREVDSIFTIKVDELLNEERIKKTDIKVGDFHLKDVPYFDLENKIIWGATALILNELKEILKQIKI